MNPINSSLDNLITYHLGYDTLTTKPGELLQWNCQICGTEATVERGVNGPTNWAEAMAKKGHIHDSFKCPLAAEAWHQTAYRLVREAESTASTMIANIIKQDLEKLLNDNLAQDN